MGRRLKLGTVRSRITLVAGLALTAAVTIGTVVVYLLQLDSGQRAIKDQLHEYATAIENSATAGGAFPNPLPPSNLDPAAAAQVLTADGRVLAATSTLRGRPAVYILPTVPAPRSGRRPRTASYPPRPPSMAGMSRSAAGPSRSSPDPPISCSSR